MHKVKTETSYTTTIFKVQVCGYGMVTNFKLEFENLWIWHPWCRL